MSSLLNSLDDTFVIFDSEFTAWKGSQERNWSRKNEEKELVQIAGLKIKKLKTTIKVIEKINIYIKPKINPVLSQYFINLTGIKQITIDKKGITFKEALRIFYKFCKNLNIYSYGNDYHIIKENLKLNKLPLKSKFYTWEKKFYDIRNFFKSFIDVNKYTSGTLYRGFQLKPTKVDIHNSLWDSTSIFLSMKYVVTNLSL